MIKHGEAIKTTPVIRSFTTSRVENWPPPDRTRGTLMEPRTAGSDSICIRTQYRSLCFMCNSFAVPLKHCCCRFVFYLVSFFLLLYFSITTLYHLQARICPTNEHSLGYVEKSLTHERWRATQMVFATKLSSRKENQKKGTQFRPLLLIAGLVVLGVKWAQRCTNVYSSLCFKTISTSRPLRGQPTIEPIQSQWGQTINRSSKKAVSLPPIRSSNRWTEQTNHRGFVYHSPSSTEQSVEGISKGKQVVCEVPFWR